MAAHKQRRLGRRQLPGRPEVRQRVVRTYRHGKHNLIALLEITAAEMPHMPALIPEVEHRRRSAEMHRPVDTASRRRTGCWLFAGSVTCSVRGTTAWRGDGGLYDRYDRR